MAAVNENVFSRNTKGGIVTTGNSIGLWGLTTPPTPNAGVPGSPITPIADGIGAFTTVNTSLQYSPYPSGTTTNWTLNSSSNLLTLPSGSLILRAWLFYGGVQINSTQNVTTSIQNAISFTPPSGTPVSITPDPLHVQSLVDSSTSNTHYHVRIDVTSLINGSGYYTVGGVPGCLGHDVNPNTQNNMYAGWTLVVAFYNEAFPTRSLNIWDTFDVIIASNLPVDIPVSGFVTPPSGTLSGKLFISATEGDNYYSGDQVQFGPNTTTLTTLFGPNNAATNFFQSQINDDNGNLMTTGTFGTSNVPFIPSGGTIPQTQSGRYGWDKTAVNASAGLQHNQTSAIIRLLSTSELYISQTVALQIDLLSASVSATKSSSKTSVFIGDVITYTIQFSNTGVLDVTNIVITDSLIAGTSYVPGSIAVNVPFTGDPTTSITLTNPLSPGATVTITFNVLIAAIPTPNPFVNTATVNYNYNIGGGVIVSDSTDTNQIVITVFQNRGIDFI